MSIHHIEEITSGHGERISLYIRWNNARLVVHLDPPPSSTNVPAIESSFIERYNVICDAEDDDEADALSDEMLAIVEAGRPIFDQLAPPPPRSGTQDTHDEASPDAFGHLFQLHVDKHVDLPKFSTKDIRVLQDLVYNGYIAHVAVEGREMCSKAGGSKGPEVAQRELDCLLKITTSKHAADIRVPKLLGLIEISHGKRIVGVLEDFIPVSDTWELSTLRNIDEVSEVASDRRRKWASQVQETVRLLHEIGVTWGNGKASNVLVHRDTDDAWIIDFGGGWTDGWVTPELSGTVEGDELAVTKIFEFLEV